MGILDLIDYGEQLKENTYIKRADLFRTNDDATKTLIPINLDDALAGDTLSNIILEPMDSVVVYSYDQVNREKLVHISGEVKNPGDYQLYNSMKLSDLIFQAGNITKQAYLVRCEIARVHFGNQTDIIKVNLEDVLLKNNPQRDIELAEDDCVFIRSIPDWRPVQMITVEGEVMFPGQYAIRHKDEQLSEIIARAGGLAPSAFPEGTIYIRKSIEKQVERRNIGQIIVNTQELARDTSGNIITDYQFKYDPILLNRIVIDLPGLLAAPGSPKDIVIADSDYVYIPTHPSGVQVIGSVAFNGTISYAKNQKAKYYLSQAGGLTPDGDEKGIRLVKANGKVYYGGKARRQKIELGDAIVVPSRIKKNVDWGKTLATTATIIGSMATTILVVDRLK
jgi:protein involved in polysaccharide export with SLBB domain